MLCFDHCMHIDNCCRNLGCEEVTNKRGKIHTFRLSMVVYKHIRTKSYLTCLIHRMPCRCTPRLSKLRLPTVGLSVLVLWLAFFFLLPKKLLRRRLHWDRIYVRNVCQCTMDCHRSLPGTNRCVHRGGSVCRGLGSRLLRRGHILVLGTSYLPNMVHTNRTCLFWTTAIQSDIVGDKCNDHALWRCAWSCMKCLPRSKVLSLVVVHIEMENWTPKLNRGRRCWGEMTAVRRRRWKRRWNCRQGLNW